MKSPYVGSVLLLVGLVIGLAIAGWQDQRANAQVDAEDAPRFQISAWGSGHPNEGRDGSYDHGCYIVNTETGELWHAYKFQKPSKISEKVR